MEGSPKHSTKRKGPEPRRKCPRTNRMIFGGLASAAPISASANASDDVAATTRELDGMLRGATQRKKSTIIIPWELP